MAKEIKKLFDFHYRSFMITVGGYSDEDMRNLEKDIRRVLEDPKKPMKLIIINED